MQQNVPTQMSMQSPQMVCIVLFLSKFFQLLLIRVSSPCLVYLRNRFPRMLINNLIACQFCALAFLRQLRRKSGSLNR
jgi:hypothetical protein